MRSLHHVALDASHGFNGTLMSYVLDGNEGICHAHRYVVAMQVAPDIVEWAAGMSEPLEDGVECVAVVHHCKGPVHTAVRVEAVHACVELLLCQ